MMATNASISVGDDGVGSMTVSNGEVQALSIQVGSGINFGTLTSAGGTICVSTLLVGGSGAGGTGTLWLTGGTLLLTNGTVSVIGSNGVGQMTMSNGTWLAQGVAVGAGGGSQGTLTVVGGTGSVFSSLTLGDSACTSVGMVVVVGGSLYVTNATHNAFIDVRDGQLNLNGGLLQTDRLILTNTCGQFIHTGGTLIVGSVLFDTNAFRITSITRQGNDLLLTWIMGPGQTNVFAGHGRWGRWQLHHEWFHRHLCRCEQWHLWRYNELPRPRRGHQHPLPLLPRAAGTVARNLWSSVAGKAYHDYSGFYCLRLCPVLPDLCRMSILPWSRTCAGRERLGVPMPSRRREFIIQVSQIGDALLIAVVFWLAHAFRDHLAYLFPLPLSFHGYPIVSGSSPRFATTNGCI